MATINPYPLSPFFSFRWVNEKPSLRNDYNNNPIDSLQDNNSYAMPWQCGGVDFLGVEHGADKGQIQYISAFPPTCKIYTCHDIFVADVEMIPIDPPLVDTDLICYNGEVNFSDLDPGRYYIKMTWDSNQPASFTASLTEGLTPDFIDGNLLTDIAGVEEDLFSNGSFTKSVAAGHPYSFTAQSLELSGATHPRLRLTVTKNGTVIYDHSIVPDGSTQINYSGIAKIAANYKAVVLTEDTAEVVTPINIDDSAAVTPAIQDWRTCPLDVEIWHPGTQKYEVSNGRNEKGAIFVNGDGTLQVISVRVHGMLDLPLPKTDTENYEDQYDDLTQLGSIPSENWTAYIGDSPDNISNYFVVPWWLIQKFNLLYSLDNKLIDGQPFNQIQGAEFKPTRPDNTINKDGYWAIDVQPNPNFENIQYQTGAPTQEGDYVVIYKAKNFDNVSVDFSMTDVFKKRVTLIKIMLYNNGLDVFTLKVGTSLGGAEIKTFEIPAILKNPLIIEYLFNENAVLYLGGLTGTNCDITIVWDDFNATNIPPPTPVTRFAKNTLYWYTEIVPDSFEEEFDVSTGLGIVGSEHEGCVLAGTNGTPDMDSKVVKGWPVADTTGLRGTVDGSTTNKLTLIASQIPPLKTENKFNNGGPGSIPVFASGTATESRPVDVNGIVGVTIPSPVNIANYSRYQAAFYYIGS